MMQEATAAEVCLTRFFDHYKAGDGQFVSRLGRVLSGYAATTLPADKTSRPLVPSKPIRSLLAYFNATDRHRLDLASRDDLDDLIRASRKVRGTGHEAFPTDVINDVFGVDYVQVLQSMIEEGPRVSGARFHALITEYLQESAPVTIARSKGGKPSASAVDARKSSIKRIWTILVELQRSGEYSELSDWTFVPSIDKTAKGLDEATIKHIPSWHQVRNALANLDTEIWDLLNVASLDEEISALAGAPKKRLAAIERLMMQRGTIAILANTGARVESVRKANVGNFAEAIDRWTWEHFPAKTIDAETAIPKALHSLTMQRIESYWAARNLRRGTALSPDQPLFASSVVKPSDPSGLPRVSYSTMRTYCRSGLNGPHPPHTIRAAVAQSLTSKQCNRVFEIHGFDYEPRMIAEVQLDHQHIPGDMFKYNGYASRQDRISILHETGVIIGEMLWTDAGKRHVKDAETFRRRLEDLRLVTAEIDFKRNERRNLAQSSRERTVSLRFLAIADEIDDLRDRKDEIQAQLTALRFDPNFEVPVPDDVAVVTVVNLAAIEQEFYAGTGNAAETVYPRVRDWITVKEFADLIGKDVKTVSRMINPEIRETTQGVRQRKRIEYWDPAKPPVDSQLGPNRRRILIDEVHAKAFASPEQQRTLSLMLASPPQEKWGPECMTVPCVPDYRRDQGDSAIAA
jgi:hypothetical protein